MEAIYAAGVDWEANWRHIVDTRREVIESLASQGPQHDYWERRADRFARMNREFKLADDSLGQIVVKELQAGDTLLDIGAGAGRYVVALAPLVASVTAVEPSPTMRGHLQAEVERRAVTNVVIVPTPWEQTIVEPHDIVLVSHVLYPIADVVPFLRKVNAAARRTCYLTIRVDDMVPQLAPLWHEVWGQERPREPGFLDLYNLLFTLGIRPDVRIVPFGSGLGFGTLDEAVEHVRRLLFVPPDTHGYDARIGAFLDEILVKETNRLTLPNLAQAAIIWWTK